MDQLDRPRVRVASHLVPWHSQEASTCRLRLVLSASSCCLDRRQQVSQRRTADLLHKTRSITHFGKYPDWPLSETAMLVNNTFTVKAAGALYLPMIGQIQAAGLREDELAKLINNRLQAQSGHDEPAVAFIRRMQNPSSQGSGSAERPRNGPDRPTLIVPRGPSRRSAIEREWFRHARRNLARQRSNPWNGNEPRRTRIATQTAAGCDGARNGGAKRCYGGAC